MPLRPRRRQDVLAVDGLELGQDHVCLQAFDGSLTFIKIPGVVAA